MLSAPKSGVQSQSNPTQPCCIFNSIFQRERKGVLHASLWYMARPCCSLIFIYSYTSFKHCLHCVWIQLERKRLKWVPAEVKKKRWTLQCLQYAHGGDSPPSISPPTALHWAQYCSVYFPGSRGQAFLHQHLEHYSRFTWIREQVGQPQTYASRLICISLVRVAASQHCSLFTPLLCRPWIIIQVWSSLFRGLPQTHLFYIFSCCLTPDQHEDGSDKVISSVILPLPLSSLFFDWPAVTLEQHSLSLTPLLIWFSSFFMLCFIASLLLFHWHTYHILIIFIIVIFTYCFSTFVPLTNLSYPHYLHNCHLHMWFIS